MTIALSASVILLAVLVFLLLGSQVEMYRTIEQLREYGGLIDRPKPIELPRTGVRPGEVGLPRDLDTAVTTMVVFLSDKCATCRSIAASLDGAVPRNVLLVIDPTAAADGMDLTMSYDLDPSRTIIDHNRRISDAVGIAITPAAVVVEHGRLARAMTVPSTRQLFVLLDTLRSPHPRQAIADQPSLAGKEPS